MKQRITIDQLQELTDEQKARLREWWSANAEIGDTCILRRRVYIVGEIGEHGLILYRPKEDDSIYYEKKEIEKVIDPLLSIGQCIAILETKNKFQGFIKSYTDGRYKVYGENIQESMIIYDSLELIDALWEAVKGVL